MADFRFTIPEECWDGRGHLIQARIEGDVGALWIDKSVDDAPDYWLDGESDG